MDQYRFAHGMRNPFRLAMDPNTIDEVKFHIGDVGASHWEEISVGGTGYAKANYGWPSREGPCKRGDTSDCAALSEYLDPFYYYQHLKTDEGGAVTGSVFVPDGLWPSEYKFLFIDFVFGRIYNLLEDSDRECRSCTPPVPGYRNETFYKLDYMVDMFFGPYKDTSALYIMSRSETEERIRRIRLTGSNNRSPVADAAVSDTTASVDQVIFFDASNSSDPDGDSLTYKWDFGDGLDTSISNNIKAEYAYTTSGVFSIELTVTDTEGYEDRLTISISVGTPPTAEIIQPLAGKQFFVGEEIRVHGLALDWSGDYLSSSQLSWEVRQHHATHWHPFLDRSDGNNFTLSPAPEPEDLNAATNSHLEIIMYAVDSKGLTTTVSRKIMPMTREVAVESVPSGLEVMIDEFPVVTPSTITTWAGHDLRLDVADHPPYIFESWSDGGARRHTSKISVANATITTFSVTFSRETFSLLVDTVRNCSSTDKCGMCEGHCEKDDECEDMLFCYRKGGGDQQAVPGCIGSDGTNTNWCTVLNLTFTAAPTTKPSDAMTAAPTTKPTAAMAVAPTPKPTAATTVKPTRANIVLIGENKTTSMPTSGFSSRQMSVHSSSSVLLWMVVSTVLVLA